MVFYAEAFAMFVVVLLLHLVRGDHFIIADTGNGRLQLCAAASRGGPFETVGSGLVSPRSVAVDNAGDFVVTDEHQIKLCSASSPEAHCETVVGFDHLGDSATELSSPQGVFWDPWRYYVIADTGNNRIQRCMAGILHARCGTATDDLKIPTPSDLNIRSVCASFEDISKCRSTSGQWWQEDRSGADGSVPAENGRQSAGAACSSSNVTIYERVPFLGTF